MEKIEKEKKKYYKKPENMKRMNKSAKMILADTNCILDVIGFRKKTHKHNLYLNTIFIDYYKSIDFIKAFSPRSSFDNSSIINPAFKKIKRKIEAMFPDVLLVTNYPISFNSAKNTRVNGAYIYLSVYIPEDYLDKNVFEKYKEKLEDVVSFVNKTIDEEMEYQSTLDRTTDIIFKSKMTR